MLPSSEDILQDVTHALQEDIGCGDVTSLLLPHDLMVRAQIISREPMLMCGQPWVNQVFAALDTDIQIQWLVKEGTILKEPAVLCDITGLVRPILTGERTALNFLQTLSATATKTNQFCQVLSGTHTRLLDTRKTIPGLRQAQKYAVRCGGGINHRMGLYDAFLIKENHIKAAGSITAAIANAKALHANIFIEIEVETLDELQEALQSKPHRIMLDNFSHDMIVRAVAINHDKVCPLEVSGNVSLESIKTLAQTGVDYISVGAITKSLNAIDLSLLIKEVL